MADARLSLAKAERELAQTEEGLDRLVLRALQDGVLIVADFWQEPRPIREGEQVWPGMTVAWVPDLSTIVVHTRSTTSTTAW